ncbi:MAG: ABC transporter permease subunit, partial [Clostridia bacterium]
ASGKLVLTLVFSILFAIVLSEARGVRTKKLVQTVCFLPHFLSWVILASIFKNIFGDTGLINEMLKKLGIISESVNFLGSNSVFPWLLIGTDVWKEFGYGAVIFIAALAGINPELYEAAEIDGAGRMAKIRHITLPGIAVTIVLVATLNLANILNAGFDQVYNLYSPVVYESGDIIDTYVYRMSFVNAQYSVATAVGLLKSVVSLIMITSSYVLAKKFTGYRLF